MAKIKMLVDDEIYNQLENLREEISDKLKSICPIGLIGIWRLPGALPYGWLECNGQQVNKNAYPELYKLMVAVPDYRNIFLEGCPMNYGVHTLFEPGLPNITGFMQQFSKKANSYASGAFVQNHSEGVHGGYDLYVETLSYTFNASWSSAVYGRSNTVQPRAYTVRYMIRAL